MTGTDLWAKNTGASGWSEFTASRVSLPTRHGGCGLYKASELVHTAFLNSINGCLKLFFRVGDSDEHDQVGLFDNLRLSFLDDSAVEDLAAFAPGEARVRTMEGWLDRAVEGTVAEAYRSAWRSVVKAGKRDLAHLLGEADMRGIKLRRDIPEEIWEEGCEQFVGRCDDNPYRWTVSCVIEGPEKLQRFLRHTRLWARRKWMLRGVAFARKGQALDVDLSVLTTGALPDWVTKMRRRLGLMTKEEARADARFISFLNVDEFARAPLECTQWEAPLDSMLFREYIATYLGIPSPACAPIVGKRVERGRNSGYHVWVDPEGLNLNTAANGVGGLRTKYHDEMQNSLTIETARAGIFTQVKHAIGIGEAVRTSASPDPANPRREWVARPDEELTGVGTQIVPDVIVDFGSAAAVPAAFRQDAALEPRRSEVLADVKTVGYTKETVYKRYETFAASWRRVLLRKPGLAVSLRANKVRRDYLRAAKKRDARFLTEEEMDEGREGPFVQTIKSFGPTIGFAVGAFGDLSSEWSTMAGHIAHARARIIKAQSGIARSHSEIAARIRRGIVCHWGSKAARGAVRMRLQITRELASLHIASSKRRGARYSDYATQKALEQARYDREGANMPYGGMGFSAMSGVGRA